MSSIYVELIEGARLIDKVETCTATGDGEYPGTLFEANDLDGRDLFYVVVDGQGQQQLLFFARKENYRIPLELFEKMLAFAKKSVAYCPDDFEEA